MLIIQGVLFKTFRKKGHPQNAEQGQGWEPTETSDSLNAFDNSETRTPLLIAQVFKNHSQEGVDDESILGRNSNLRDADEQK